jgi:photosystem II stability/assembly factor-like uncharacterized protein
MFDGMSITPGLKGFIYVSVDSGVTWTPRSTEGNWFSVATSADGRKMVAVQYLPPTFKFDDVERVPGIYHSTDAGTSWTRLKVALQGEEVEPAPWISIASSADGTKLVAVDQKYYSTQEGRDRPDAGPGALWTSTDSGETWVIQAVPGMNRRWTAVAMSGNGNVIIGLIYNSDHWISRDGGERWLKGGNEGIEWRKVAISSDGEKMMAIVEDPAPMLASTDGGGVTAVGPTRRWADISLSADGSHLAATAYGNNCPKRNDDGSYGKYDDPGEILTSANSGAGWTSRSKSKSWSLITSSSDGKVLAAASSVTDRMANGHIRGKLASQLFISQDYGATWTPHETARYWTALAVSADGSRIAAVGKDTQIYVSDDSGETWTAHETAREWVAIASSADGGKLVAAAISGRLYTSADAGETWTARLTDQHWRAVASSADGRRLLAAAKSGWLYTSSDSGATWTKRAFKTEWVSVACSGDGSKMIAASNIGELVISTDGGATWKTQEGG